MDIIDNIFHGIHGLLFCDSLVPLCLMTAIEKLLRSPQAST